MMIFWSSQLRGQQYLPPHYSERCNQWKLLGLSVSTILIVCFCISLVVPTIGRAASRFSVGGIPEITWLGSLELNDSRFKSPDITKVVVKPRLTSDTTWFGEDFKLDVHTKSGAVVSMPFSAAYGSFELYVPDGLSAGFFPNIMLINAIGKGTSATHYVLTIYGIDGNKLKPQFTKTIAGFFGPGVMWWYTWQFHSASGTESTALELRLHHNPPSGNALEDPKLIPKTSVVCVFWSKNKFQENDEKCP